MSLGSVLKNFGSLNSKRMKSEDLFDSLINKSAGSSEERNVNVPEEVWSFFRNSTPESNTLQYYGTYLFFTNQFDKANDLIEKSCSNDSEKALLYGLFSFLYGLSSFSERHLEEASSRIWKAEKIAKNEESQPATFIRGTTVRAHVHFLQALLCLVEENYLKSVWHFKKTAKLLERAKKTFPSYMDYLSEDARNDAAALIDIGFGIFGLLASILPPKAIAVVEWFGICGDRENAITLLNEVFLSNTLYSPWAAFYLLVYYLGISDSIGILTEENHRISKRLLDWSNSNFPGSVMFMMPKSFYKRSLKLLEQSREVALEGFNLSSECPGIQLLFIYNIGWCSFLCMDYTKHIHEFRQLLAQFSHLSLNKSFLCLCEFMIGISNFIMEKPDDTRKSFQKTLEIQRSFSSSKELDKYIKRKCKLYLDGKLIFAIIEKCVLLAHFNYYGHLTSDQLHNLSRQVCAILAETKSLSDYYKVACSVCLAYIHFSLNDLDTCDAYLCSSVQLAGRIPSEECMLAHIYYLQARVMFAKSRIDDALKCCAQGIRHSSGSEIMEFRLYGLNRFLKSRNSSVLVLE
jgi:tetratricopeptide (TPR) repeat protein